MIVHLGTQIQSVFGRLDDNGNVVERWPVNLQADVLTLEVFQQALAKVLEFKAQQQSKTEPVQGE